MGALPNCLTQRVERCVATAEPGVRLVDESTPRLPAAYRTAGCARAEQIASAPMTRSGNTYLESSIFVFSCFRASFMSGHWTVKQWSLSSFLPSLILQLHAKWK